MIEEPSPQNPMHIAQRAVIAEWTTQVNLGHLTDVGLERLRFRLRNPEKIEFIPGTDVDFLLVRVDEALAEMRGIDPADLPGSPLATPDTPEGLDGE